MIEIARGSIATIYRINEDNACEILQRPNRAYARWKAHSAYESADVARATLLRIQRGTWQEEEKE